MLKLQRKPDTIYGEFAYYLFFGGLVFGVDFALLIILTEVAGLGYLTSAFLAFLAGLTTMYVFSVSLVFRWRTYNDRVLEFGYFALCGIGGLALNQLSMYLLVEEGSLHYTTSKVVAAAIVFGWNFASRKLLLFRRRAV
jgi:putative flippase GtrA